MAESDASRLVQLSKSIQAPTPKWHKTVKTCTPRLATPQTLTGGKPVAAYTSTEKHRVGKGYSSHRHHHDKSTRSSKLEKEDGDRFIPNRTLTDLNYASHQMLHGEDAATTDEEHKSMYEFGSSCKRKVKGILDAHSRIIIWSLLVTVCDVYRKTTATIQQFKITPKIIVLFFVFCFL